MTLTSINPHTRQHRLVMALLVGTLAYLMSIMIHDSFDFIDKNYHAPDHFYALLIMVLFIEGMWAVAALLDKRLPDNHQFRLKAFVQVLVSIVFISVLIALADALFPNFTLNELRRFEDMDDVERSRFIKKVRVYSTFGLVAILLNIAYFGWHFFRRFHVVQLEAEQLHRETVANQLQTLKNQIHPKFWFDSLEALIKLVHQDADLSEKFIKKLSLFYRFNLTNNEKELITLDEELEFVQIYLDLINIRSEQGVSLHQNAIDSASRVGMLPSRALQKVLEYTLQSNLYDASHPMQLSLQINPEGNLIVEYTELKKLRANKVTTSAHWLDELNQIYQFYTPQEVCERVNGEFRQIVLPLLQVEGFS